MASNYGAGPTIAADSEARKIGSGERVRSSSFLPTKSQAALKAELFPAMSKQETEALAEDMKASELTNPIIIWTPSNAPAEGMQ